MADVSNQVLRWDVSAVFMDRLVALPNVSELYKEVTDAIRARFQFDPNKTIMMDFACGNGMSDYQALNFKRLTNRPGPITVLLAPHCKSVIGVDISPGMVAAFERNMKSKSISNTQTYSVKQGLLPEEAQLAGQKFDAIVVCSYLSASSLNYGSYLMSLSSVCASIRAYRR
jgi:SAM-dependent methyltransferase